MSRSASPSTRSSSRRGRRRRGAGDLAGGLAERGAAGVLLPAAAVAAGAQPAVGHDPHVPPLPRHAVRAAPQPAVQHDAAADAGAQRDHQRQVGAAGRAVAVLGPGRGVGVVAHPQRPLQPGGEVLAQGGVPPGQVRAEQHGVAGAVEPAGRADARRRPVRRRARPRAPRRRRRSRPRCRATEAPGVARRAVARIVPSGATTPPATFVPPMSMPSAASPAASRAVTRSRSAGRRAASPSSGVGSSASASAPARPRRPRRRRCAARSRSRSRTSASAAVTSGRSPRTTAAAWQTGHQRQSAACSPVGGGAGGVERRCAGSRGAGGPARSSRYRGS